MMPRPSPRFLLSFLAAAVLSGGCAPDRPRQGPGAGVDSVVVVDALGRRVRLDEPARRMVSLVPSATLTLAALEARAVLVGRTDFDTVTWAADVPSVGGGLQPSLEAVVALEPDVVILFGGDQDPVTPQRLDEVGIPWVGIRPDRVEDVLGIVRTLGVLTGRTDRADALVDSLRTELDAIRRAAVAPPGPSVAYVMGGTPPWVAGPGTYIDELIELAGGRNAFADLDALYSAVGPEEMVSRAIDLVLVSDLSTFDRRLTPSARVVEVGGALQLPGPGVVDAAKEVAAAVRSTVR